MIHLLSCRETRLPFIVASFPTEEQATAEWRRLSSIEPFDEFYCLDVWLPEDVRAGILERIKS